MMHRFKHYRRNVGSRYTLINLLIVAYLVYHLFGGGFDPVMLVVGSLIGAGVLLPRLFLNLLVANPARTSRVLHIGTILIAAVFILSITKTWVPPLPLAIAIPPLVGLLLGTNFWLLSDPRVLTADGLAYYTSSANPNLRTHAHDTSSSPDHLPPLPR
ncbi:MAG: hypothetical protein ACF8MJ_06590 [Phycisphaerales bacterium JB050]